MNGTIPTADDFIAEEVGDLTHEALRALGVTRAKLAEAIGRIVVTDNDNLSPAELQMFQQAARDIGSVYNRLDAWVDRDIAVLGDGAATDQS